MLTLQAEKRHAELKKMGLEGKIVLIGKKGITYFNRRQDQYDIVGRPPLCLELCKHSNTSTSYMHLCQSCLSRIPVCASACGASSIPKPVLVYWMATLESLFKCLIHRSTLYVQCEYLQWRLHMCLRDVLTAFTIFTACCRKCPSLCTKSCCVHVYLTFLRKEFQTG